MLVKNIFYSSFWKKSINKSMSYLYIKVNYYSKKEAIVSQLFNDHRIKYKCFGPHNEIKQSPLPNKKTLDNLIYFVKTLLIVLLPKGYPGSVCQGYKNFAIGQFVGMLFSSAGGVLSTQSLLYAMGLGIQAIPIAATLNWVIKDGIGQFGGVIFASTVSNQFDSNPKKWRMIASISLDISSYIELMTPLVPMYFLPLASIANIGKNISYLAASASRAAIHKSFAIHENLADVTAKSGSQSITSSMLGTALGIGIASLIGNDYFNLFLAYFSCSSIHLIATYYSLKNVTLSTVCPIKLETLFDIYKVTGAISTPRELSPLDTILSLSPKNYPRILVGSKLSDSIHTYDELQV